jgi:hypothetical protein
MLQFKAGCSLQYWGGTYQSLYDPYELYYNLTCSEKYKYKNNLKNDLGEGGRVDVTVTQNWINSPDTKYIQL